jgi:hypothetical protein
MLLDAGFNGRLVYAVIGFLPQIRCPGGAVEKWLHYAALTFNPNSAYAKHALGDTWRSTDDEVIACVIRRKSATDSDAIRPPIPTEVGHPFRLKPATL